jgi:nicotinamide-nucleotide amidase
VELVCVGTELLTGKLNTHGAYFSAQLEDLGLPLARETTVSDDPAEMEAVFREVWRRADVVLVTGGLGPTFDDLTREVWARVLGRRLVLRADLLAGIRDRFRRRGLPMPPANRRQARVMQGARVLANPNGTAPGQLVEFESKILVLLPGPGRELKPMVEGDVFPYLRERFSKGSRKTRVWRLFGLAESRVDQRLRPLLASGDRSNRGTTWGILAQGGIVDVKATVAGPDIGSVEATLGRWDRWLRRRFGDAIFGVGTDTLEAVVGAGLRARNRTLATAESCTGGLLAERVTSVSGSSDYYWGGVVSYANEAKVRELGVKRETLRRFGAVSGKTAREMAAGLRRRAKTEYALSVTGIAGPGGGSAEKPVGLVFIGMAGPEGIFVVKKTFLGDRSFVRQQSVLWALDHLRRALIKRSGGQSLRLA